MGKKVLLKIITLLTMKKLITLPAHFNGESTILDTPFELKSDDKLLVTVLFSSSHTEEKDGWFDVSANQLNRAYSEEELQYSQVTIKGHNPQYKNRR